MIIAIRTNNSETREETEFLKKKMLTDYMDEIQGKRFFFKTKPNKSRYGIDVILEVKDSADVVEVVRCKDCIARGSATLEPFVCRRNKIIVYNNSYCSYGERREE